MKLLVRSLMFVVCVAALSACKTMGTLTNSGDFTPPQQRNLQPIKEGSEVPSTSDLDGHAMNIIWHVGKDVRDQLALSSDIKEGLTYSFKESGIQIKNPNDKKTTHLIEEIERARQNARSLTTGMGERKVDYYVKAALTKSSLSSSYSNPVWCPLCEEKRKGSCTFELDSGLQIEVLSLPSLRRVKHFNVTFDESFSVDVFDRCASYSAMPESENEYNDSREEIIEDLISCSGKSLVAYLSPQAYIEKYYSDGESHIYQVSAGSAAGFKEGDSLVVSRQSDAGDVQLGEAQVVSVQEYKSYIEVSDRKLVDEIRQYDKVKVEYTDYTMGLGCLGAITEH